MLASLTFTGIAPGFAVEAEALPAVLDLDAAASLLRVGPGVVRALAERQAIPARRVGDEWRFARDALLDWLKGDRLAGMATVSQGRSEAAGPVRAATPKPDTDAIAPPVTVGERPAVQVAGEVALRDQRVLLARGAASTDVGVSYAHSEQALYPVARVEQNVAGASATLRYGLADDLQLNTRVPGVFQRTVAYVDASVAGTGAPMSKRESYLGDVSVSLLGVAAHEAVGRPNLIWSIDSVVPSGPGDRGIGGGLVMSKSYDPAVLFVGVSYLYGLATDSASARRVLTKHNVGLNLGFTVAVNDTLALNTLLIGNYRTTRSADGVVPPPARERYQLQFGMTWMLAPDLFLEPAVGLRLGGSSPDVQFSLNLLHSL